ncbi:class I SAM-dependent methyltransferase, partial [Candidatus Pelagibacter bacterium]|nr:class I SAM-dependent methyltransferase [Candidatus Pelagibacter bacterium]
MLRFNIKNVPVFWREANNFLPSKKIPSKYPMLLTYDDKTKLIKQPYLKKTDQFLKKIYKANENIGYLQEDNPLKKIYGPEFIEFVLKNIKSSKSKVLEIGCGGMYTLNELKKRGHYAYGCDPSPIANDASKKYQIKLFKDFFPTKKNLKMRFEAVIHYDLLEHVWKPKQFIKECYKILEKNGKIIFVVPDSTHQIKNGDISLFIHQHVNYFSKNSLKLFLNDLGFSKVFIKRSNLTGVLMCVASNINRNFEISNARLINLTKKENFNFFYKAKKNYINIKKLISKDFLSLKSKEKIGFYPPLRAMPYLSSFLERKYLLDKIIFIDDNKKVKNKYICDLPLKILP